MARTCRPCQDKPQSPTEYKNWVGLCCIKRAYHISDKYVRVSGADDIANNVELATISAMWYFQTRVLNKVDINTASVAQVTKHINAKLLGLDDRKRKYLIMKNINK